MANQRQRTQSTRYVGPLILPRDEYDLLLEQARAAERDELQQARWLIRQALVRPAQPTPEREGVPV